MPAIGVGLASRLALSNLLQERLRLALSVLGVALSVMLILFLIGLEAGVFEGSKAYLSNSPGSVVVMPKGVRDTIAVAAKYLPAGTVETVAATDGVARVTPVVRTGIVPELHGKKEYIVLIGYDPQLGAGPWQLASGREPAADDEIVLDRVLADRHGFKAGDTLEIGDRQLRVVGTSKGTSSWVGTYAFVSKAVAESLVLQPGASNILLVSPKPGTKASDVVARLQSLPGANALLKTQVIDSDQKVLANVFSQVLNIMVAAAFVVGTLVVGLVIYTATLERQREYGVLKAFGAHNGFLYRTVISQALIASGLGVVLGVALAFLMGQLVMVYRPQFLVVIQPSAIAGTLAAGFLIALIGALLPAKAVAKLAPAEVFRR